MKKEPKTKRKGLRLVSSIIILLAITATVVGVYSRRAAAQQDAPGTAVLEASGVIQAAQITIASEFGGKVAAIPVSETDDVQTGQLVIQLDTAMLDAQIEVMQAMVDAAEAGLAQARAGAKPSQIAVAEAQLAQAQAGQVMAQQALSDTHLLIATPQNLDLEIAMTYAQLESAEHKLHQAIAFKDAIELGKKPLDEAYARFDGGGREKFEVGEGALEDLPDDLPDLPIDIPDLPIDVGDIPDGDYSFGDWEIIISDGMYNLSRWVNIDFPLGASLMPNIWWQSWIGVNAATAQRDALQAKLADLYKQHANPQEMQARADEAQSATHQVDAQITLAQIQIDALKDGATATQLAAIEARVNQAYSGLDALLQQRDMLALHTPITGTVIDISVHPGEVAAQGATLITIADLDKLSLTVYVPQNHLGQVKLDQGVQIKVNSFPDQIFAGRVTRIANRAEFTPRNVATKEERVNLVFAIEISVINVDNALKPGMPVDVVFEGF